MYSISFHVRASDHNLAVRPKPEFSRVSDKTGRNPNPNINPNPNPNSGQDSTCHIKLLPSRQLFSEWIVHTFCLNYLGTLETQKVLKNPYVVEPTSPFGNT